jgi:predicted ATP-binding protein involved in virulence
MRIDRLRVQNFRCFDDREWNFSPGFNVLIGENGAGKTAALDSLAVGVGAFLLGIDDGTARSIQEEDVRLSYRAVSAGADGFASPPRFSEQFPVSVATEGFIDGTPYNWSRSRHSKKGQTRWSDAQAVKDVAYRLQIQARHDEDVTLPVIAYYTIRRRWNTDKEDVAETVAPTSRLHGYTNSLRAELLAPYVYRWFKTMELGQKQYETEFAPLRVVSDAVSRCMPEGAPRSIEFDVLLNELVGVDAAANRSRLRLLSEGQRNTISLVMDLAYRVATLNPHFGIHAARETPGVVLIDEIDLHLHPRWQRDIVNQLRRTFPRVQFFVTTHSPVILQNLNPAEDCVIRLDASAESTYSIGDFADQPVEDVLIEQGYEEPHLSSRRREMIAAAEDYYRLLKQAKTAPPAELDQLKQRMDDLALPYHDNPAYIAFLNMERRAELGDKA